MLDYKNDPEREAKEAALLEGYRVIVREELKELQDVHIMAIIYGFVQQITRAAATPPVKPCPSVAPTEEDEQTAMLTEATAQDIARARETVCSGAPYDVEHILGYLTKKALPVMENKERYFMAALSSLTFEEQRQFLRKYAGYLERKERAALELAEGEKWKGYKPGTTKTTVCIETGARYASLKEAAERTGINAGQISAACNKRRETAGGYHWKYEAPKMEG